MRFDYKFTTKNREYFPYYFFQTETSYLKENSVIQVEQSELYRSQKYRILGVPKVEVRKAAIS